MSDRFEKPIYPEQTAEMTAEAFEPALTAEAAGQAEAAPAEPQAPFTAEEQPVAETPAEEQPAVEEPEIDSFGRRRRKPYYERAYLNYGGSLEESPEDLAGTKAFLEGLGFDGGELRRARRGKGYSEAVKSAEGSDNSGMFCAYCGMPVSGVDYYRLPDGRVRCTTCSRTLVKTAAELKEIYNKVLLNLEVFFNASIKVPIEIEMLEERRLKKKLKRPLSEVDNNSMLILGVAVSKNKQYSICLENGAPRLSVIATFAHELTHIWQYTNWDKLPKLKGDARLLMYEGMAKWAEIQYLYLIGETAIAKREEAYTRTRKDEYGYGFLLYVNKYPLSRDNMPAADTPFKTDEYPIGQ